MHIIIIISKRARSVIRTAGCLLQSHGATHQYHCLNRPMKPSEKKKNKTEIPEKICEI